MMIDDKAWLKELKPGDAVIVLGAGWYDTKQKCTVDKLTPSGLIKVNGTLYYSDTWQAGRERSGDRQLLQATPEALQEIVEAEVIARAIHKMQRLSGKTIDYGTAVKILGILGEATP